MLLDLFALVILALFSVMGALRGGVASVASLATLLLSYAVAVWAAGSLGDAVSEKLGMPVLLGTALAGTVAFLATAVLGGVLGAVVKREAKSLRGDSPIGTANRWVGGVFGALRGGLIVLLLAWLAIWLDAARETGSFAGLEAVPEIDSSSTVKLTERVVQGAVRASMDEGAAADVVARFASRPGSAVRSLQALLAAPQIQTLQQDRFFWTLVENGAYRRAMNLRSFQQIAHDDRLRSQFADLGVISPEAAVDPGEFRRELGPVLAEVGPKLKGLANDPELQRLARDPEITAMLESGDTLGLMRHPGIHRLAAKVSGSR
jgi:membrane protein required for colicin V production